ncbi:Adaptive-response sensory-kinase SasA [subsurface metagenome]
MNIKILFAAFAVALNLGLIIFVSFRNRRHTVYKTFILMSFCLLMWNLRVVVSSLIETKNISTIYFNILNQIYYPLVTACLYLLPVLALHFTISFIEIRSGKMKYFIRICYILAVLLSLIYIMNIFSSRTYDYMLEFFVLPLFIISLIFIGRAYFRSTRPLEQGRLGLLFIGGTVGVTGAFAEDIFSALGINTFGIGNVATAFYSSLVAISIFRHRLFDVNLTIRRLTGFFLTLLILILISYLLSEVFKLSILAPYVYLFIVVAIILVFGNRIMLYVENILFKKSKSSSQAITEINSILETAKNTNDIFEISSKILKNNLNISEIAFCLYDSNLQIYRLTWPAGLRNTKIPELSDSNYLIKWFKYKPKPLILDEAKHLFKFGNLEMVTESNFNEMLAEFETLGYEAYIPMMFEDNLEGLIFTGAKNNGRAFNNADIHSLELIANTCTLWLQRFRMLEKIRHLEQLAALGEMSAYIAHEVKNPLAIIRSSAQLINSNTQDSKFTNLIIDECDKLNRVVNKLLYFSKTSTPLSEKVNVKKEVTACVKEISNNLSFKNIEMPIFHPRNILIIKFDIDQFKQVITNLLLNATEAMKGAGKIEISISEDGKGRVTLRIKDNGPGINFEDQTKIFDPFYSTKPGGTGLGLPITKKLLALNNSNMRIISKPGKGCEVIINLPYWKE